MQSWQTCALSGEQISAPVVSRISGHIFERRLIEKHIESTGTCPITGRPLNLEDLIDIKVAPVQKPRPVTATSIPSLLTLMQSEWDALLLEQFQLKSHLEQVRQELTHSLYQHDAACRVIAKLIKERDEARIELAQLQSRVTGNIQIENNALPQDVVEEIEQSTIKLSGQRKAQRKLPQYFEQFPSQEVISNYELKQTNTVAATVAVDVSQDQLIVLGGSHGEVQVYDREERKVIWSKNHKSKINTVKFIYIDESTRVLSVSSDSLSVDNIDDQSNSYSWSGQHIVGAAVHPIGYLVIVAQNNGVVTFHDIRKGRLLFTLTDFQDQAEFNSIAIHPDGHFLALGCVSQIKVWSITGNKLLAQLEGQQNNITALVFSESGAILASSNGSEVAIWSLRTSEITHRLLNNEKIGSLTFDPSGQSLAVGTHKFINLFDTKKWQIYSKLEAHRDVVTGVAFGPYAHSIISAGVDKIINIYN